MEPTKLVENLERLYGADQEQRLRVIADLANESFYHKTALAREVQKAEIVTYQPREIKTVALYYRNIVNGGAQPGRLPDFAPGGASGHSSAGAVS